MNMDRIHSVTLIEDKCMGCTNCLKRCPTEAIRVRKGKAQILSGRCIDCGECIRICPHHAKQAVYDTIAVLDEYDYTIAMPAPSLYGQFPSADSIDEILSGLMELGFDEIFEVSRAAELISDATREYIESGNYVAPIISSACPTITRLIQIRFPNLIENILPIITPAELAGRMAREEAVRKTGLPPDRIGTVFITPCPAKVTTIANPLGIEKSNLSAAIAIKDIYPLLLGAMKKAAEKGSVHPIRSGRLGVGWGSSGGEAEAMLDERYLAADGIENCIRVLENLEDKKYNLDFVELNACPGGCVGGVLAIENPYIAMVRLKQLRQDLPVVGGGEAGAEVGPLTYSKPLEYEPIMELDENLEIAMDKMREIDAINASLRGLDCGSCGSPSCRAFAEDIVRGTSQKDECIFVLRESMKSIAKALEDLSGSWDDRDE